MTTRESRELTLQHWPRLGVFPTVPALVVSCILAWTCTGVVALGGAIIFAFWPKVHIVVPDTWYTALYAYTGYALLQFGTKRVTYKPENGNGHGNGTTPAAGK